MSKTALLAAVLALASSIAAGRGWSTCAPCSVPRWNPAGVVLGGKIYLMGGQDSTPPYASMATVEVYDPMTDTWEAGAPMPTSRWGLMAAVVGGKIYAIGGRSGSFAGGHYASSAVEEYDPVLDTWSAKASMPTARGWGGCVAWNDTIFVFGGYGNSALKTVEKYHPASDAWSGGVNLPVSRYMFGTALVHDRTYIIGGYNALYRVDEFNHYAGTWTARQPMLTGRAMMGVGAVGDSVIIAAGGREGTGNEVEIYDPAANGWTALSPMPTAREGLAGMGFGSRFYAIAGSVPLTQGGLPYLAVNEMAENLAGAAGGSPEREPMPLSLSARPNPFSKEAVIDFRLPESSMVSCAVFDVAGRRVKNLVTGRRFSPAAHRVAWNGTDDRGRPMSNGVFFCRLEACGKTLIEKLLLVR